MIHTILVSALNQMQDNPNKMMTHLWCASITDAGIFFYAKYT